jgi:hypothetical protein
MSYPNSIILRGIGLAIIILCVVILTLHWHQIIQ